MHKINNSSLSSFTKIAFLIHIVFTCVSAMQSTDNNSNNIDLNTPASTIDAESVSQDLNPVNKWEYTKKIFLQELAHQQGYLNAIGEKLKQFNELLAALCIIPLTPIIVYLLAIRTSLGENNDDASGFRLWASAIGLSVAAFATLMPIISYVGKFLANSESHCYHTLNIILQDWPDHKPNTPAILHEHLDKLYAGYLNNNNTTTLDMSESLYLVESIISLATIAEKLKLIYTNTKKNNNDSHDNQETLIALYQTACAHFANLSIQQVACTHEQEMLNTDVKSDSNKWEYIARQLELVNPHTPMGNILNHIIRTYQTPLSIVIGAPLGLVLGVPITNRITHDDLAWRAAARIFGPVVGYALITTLCDYFGQQEMVDQRTTNLINFVSDWSIHKNHTPVIMHNLFNTLNKLYKQHDNSLNIDHTVVDETYRIIVSQWFGFIASSTSPAL